MVRESKHLSKILRHDPGSVGLTLDASGWVAVEDLLQATGMTLQVLDRIVSENDKKRFEFNDDKTRIRASQGHSVEVDLGYVEKEPPTLLYHGTGQGVLSSIWRQGLLKMARHHVHLSDSVDKAMVVARRRKDSLVLTVKAQAMLGSGFKFYLSTNGVWLTDYVPPSFIDGLGELDRLRGKTEHMAIVDDANFFPKKGP